MARLPESFRRSPEAAERLERIQAEAKIRHERKRRTAQRQGRDFPLLPYEYSWAYETAFDREARLVQS